MAAAIFSTRQLVVCRFDEGYSPDTAPILRLEVDPVEPRNRQIVRRI